MARQYYEDSTTGQMKPLGVKVEDTLPVGTIVEYNGQNIPEGWVDIGSGKIEKQYQVIPTNAKLENGDSTSATNGYTADYINNHSVVVSPTEPTGSARKKVWKQHNYNLFDKNNANILQQIWIDVNTLYTDQNSKTLYIKCEKNTTYSISKVVSSRFIVAYTTTLPAFDVAVNGRIQNNSASRIDITTDNSAEYLVVYYYNSSHDTLTEQQILDSIIIKEKLEDKEYILNDNDIYEEFNPQNEIYSTSETRIGTWIDGKPIYRKVFTGTLANDANSYNIGTITDIDNEVNSYGRTIVGGTTSYYTPLNIYLDSNFRSLVQITTTTGQIVVTYGNTFKGCAFEYVIEYTKTTD